MIECHQRWKLIRTLYAQHVRELPKAKGQEALQFKKYIGGEN